MSCEKNNKTEIKKIQFDFKQSFEDWQPFFSDYPADSGTLYELEFSSPCLPQQLDTTSALKISANNQSDDLLYL